MHEMSVVLMLYKLRSPPTVDVIIFIIMWLVHWTLHPLCLSVLWSMISSCRTNVDRHQIQLSGAKFDELDLIYDGSSSSSLAKGRSTLWRHCCWMYLYVTWMIYHCYLSCAVAVCLSVCLSVCLLLGLSAGWWRNAESRHPSIADESVIITANYHILVCGLSVVTPTRSYHAANSLYVTIQDFHCVFGAFLDGCG